jgi:hypothetical protein
MTRLFSTTGLFVFIMAAGLCPMDECGTADDCKDSDFLGPEIFEIPFLSFRALSADCSTCDHAAASAAWEPGTGGASGEVVVSFQASCAANPFGFAPHVQRVAADARNVAFSGLGVKNVCGDNATVNWELTVTNGSSTTINNVRLAITCPKPGQAAPASPTSPSGSGG